MKKYEMHKNEKIIGKVFVADNFITRLRGLVGRELKQDEGLLLSPCNQVHCFLMSYPIDVIYLTSDWTVLRIDEAMMPGSIGRRTKGCRTVLEMKAGNCKENLIAIGDKLILIGMEE